MARLLKHDEYVRLMNELGFVIPGVEKEVC
jgi:hypothetical protein